LFQRARAASIFVCQLYRADNVFIRRALPLSRQRHHTHTHSALYVLLFSGPNKKPVLDCCDYFIIIGASPTFICVTLSCTGVNLREGSFLCGKSMQIRPHLNRSQLKIMLSPWGVQARGKRERLALKCGKKWGTLIRWNYDPLEIWRL
jgi:hypothetical protein